MDPYKFDFMLHNGVYMFYKDADFPNKATITFSFVPTFSYIFACCINIGKGLIYVKLHIHVLVTGL